MISDEIRRLHELHQAGALTTEEFERAKAKVLAGAGPNERSTERVCLNKDGGAAGNGYDAGFEARPGLGARDFKSLRRARVDRWLGGVCGGLAGERVNLHKDRASSGPGVGAQFEAGANAFEAQIRALRRSRRERWLGGVCGGLNGVLGLETWVWRLVFLLFALITSGFGALVYLLMWIFVPEE